MPRGMDYWKDLFAKNRFEDISDVPTSKDLGSGRAYAFGTRPGAPNVPVGNVVTNAPMHTGRLASGGMWTHPALIDNEIRTPTPELRNVQGAYPIKWSPAMLKRTAGSGEKSSDIDITRLVGPGKSEMYITQVTGRKPSEKPARAREVRRLVDQKRAANAADQARADADQRKIDIAKAASENKIQEILAQQSAIAGREADQDMRAGKDVTAPGYEAEQRRRSVERMTEEAAALEAKGKVEQANIRLKAALAAATTTKEVVDYPMENADGELTDQRGQTITTTTHNNPMVGDANMNGIADEDEKYMRWAKEHRASDPIKAKAIEETMKKKYPQVYGAKNG